MRNSLWSLRLASAFLAFCTVASFMSPVGAAQQLRTSSTRPSTESHTKLAGRRLFPVGTHDPSSPSDLGPPKRNALQGYTLSYVNDFGGSSLPPGWEVFTGTPVGDTGGQWGASHVTVSGGVLSLSTWRDPAYGNEWVSGGVSQVGVAHTYGAYFVRSRLTGSGPTQVEMLWPVVGWPPEIDFDETYGNTNGSMATDHFTLANAQIHRTVAIAMTQWHTWGVIWTPTRITYTVDGRVWGKVSGAHTIPDQPMSLHIQQQTWCNSSFACPTATEATQVDWVAEYTPSVNQTDTIGQFPAGSSSLTPSLESQVENVAQEIATEGDPTVSITAYDSAAITGDVALANQRAQAVSSLLQQDLASLDVSGIRVETSSEMTATSNDVIASPVHALGNVLVQIR